MTTKLKDILTLAVAIVGLFLVFFGIWAGDEYHNAYYGLSVLGAIIFIGTIFWKSKDKPKT
jgi:prepilin signal peptidase PulO-like enzyme (type II secretory pathway)